jgi:hypothetical protein
MGELSGEPYREVGCGLAGGAELRRSEGACPLASTLLPERGSGGFPVFRINPEPLDQARHLYRYWPEVIQGELPM